MAKLDRLLTAINEKRDQRKILEQKLAMYNSGQLAMSQDELSVLDAQLEEHRALINNVRSNMEGYQPFNQ